MTEPTINEDELVGYIMRKVNEDKDLNLMYEDVRYVLDAHIDYMIEKSIAEEADQTVNKNDSGLGVCMNFDNIPGCIFSDFLLRDEESITIKSLLIEEQYKAIVEHVSKNTSCNYNAMWPDGRLTTGELRFKSIDERLKDDKYEQYFEIELGIIE